MCSIVYRAGTVGQFCKGIESIIFTFLKWYRYIFCVVGRQRSTLKKDYFFFHFQYYQKVFIKTWNLTCVVRLGGWKTRGIDDLVFFSSSVVANSWSYWDFFDFHFSQTLWMRIMMIFSCHGWWCGYSELRGSGKVCDCSGEEITQDEYRDKKKCCSPPGDT